MCTEPTLPVANSWRASEAAGLGPIASLNEVKRSWPIPDSDRLSSKRTTPGVALRFSVTPTIWPIRGTLAVGPGERLGQQLGELVRGAGHHRGAQIGEVGCHRPVVNRCPFVTERQQREHAHTGASEVEHARPKQMWVT